ncbi:MAG: sulfite exporter TauE/SafE family protein [Bacteroidaceae bacterium]|nr:sulfite exporter TauE/SafE family protein [Bacteroidaceae bacterium]
MSLLSVFLLSIAASFVQRVSGFGFGIFIMMFLPYVMPSYNEAVALSGLLSGTTALFIVLGNVRHVCWSKLPVISFFNALVSYFIISYMLSLSSESMLRYLGAALVLVALYFLFSKGRAGAFITTFWAQCVVGAVSGVMGSMFGMPGPPVVLYGVNAIPDKKAYMATMQAFWLLFNCFYLACRAGGGYYSRQTPIYWLIGLLGVAVGVLFGARCYNSFDNKTFKRIVYSVMLLSGIIALLK